MEATLNTVTVINHPVVKHNLSVMRNEKTDGEKFRCALKRISYALFLEATKNLPTEIHPASQTSSESENYNI